MFHLAPNSDDFEVAIASIPDSVRVPLFGELSQIIPVSDTHKVEQYSYEPPAWVEIIGNVISWSNVLKVAAGAYLARIAQLAAEHHWQNRQEIGRHALDACGNAVRPLRQLFTSLKNAQQELGRRIVINVSIPGPSNGRTLVRLSLDNEEEFVEKISLFIEHIEGVKAAISHLGPDGIAYLASCEIDNDHLIMKWQHRISLQPLQRRFDLLGAPAGPEEPLDA